MSSEIPSSVATSTEVHVLCARTESVPILGVIPSCVHAIGSLGEALVGGFNFTGSGGICCIPWNAEGGAFCATCGAVQQIGCFHLLAGSAVFGESLLNIATLGCYRTTLSFCAPGCGWGDEGEDQFFNPGSEIELMNKMQTLTMKR